MTFSDPPYTRQIHHASPTPMPFSLSNMDIRQVGPGAAEEFLPRYTAHDSSPPPTYNVNDNTTNNTTTNNNDDDNVMTLPANNEDLPPPSAQHEAPKPPSPAHLARHSRMAIFAQMVFHHHHTASRREERLPTYESVDRLDRLSQRPMSPPRRRRRRSQWRKYRAAIILYLIVSVLVVVGVCLLAIYSNSLEAGEDGGMKGREMGPDSAVGRERI